MKREFTAARISIDGQGDFHRENVVERLRRRIRDVRISGTVVRTDWLDGQQASWCELRGIRTIILDATQPASDQLSQLEEILHEIKELASPHTAPSLASRSTNRAA